ncbi:MAG TPA: monovalent cation/H(+) antiporter subunit G [Ideonella sp.]|nr:monovalent cation/H(+) antiporter subunit G [Ideonella sp.]
MSVVVAVLVGLAVAINLLSAIGALVMRDAYQRLHYLAPASSLAPLLLTVAFFLGEPDKLVGCKMLVLLLVVNAVNGVATHATARAARIRDGLPFGDQTDEERRAQAEASP